MYVYMAHTPYDCKSTTQFKDLLLSHLVMRKKVKLAFIVHDASRKATYNKRKNGLLKKVSELSILCGVPACAIIYGEQGTRLDTWPPSPISVRRVISKFLEMPAMEQSKKMVDQEGFLQDRVARADEQLKKLRKDNREMEMTCVMLRALEGSVAPGWFEGLTMLDLTDLEWVIDQTMKQVDQMQEKLSEATGFLERINVATNEEARLVEGSTSTAQSKDHFMGLTDPLEQAALPRGNATSPSSSI